MKRVSTEDFILKANEIHKNRYDYSKTIYVNTKTKVVIICKEHGEFSQQPNSHIHSKQGCPICKGGVKSNINDFILKSNKIHNYKYDYSKSNYINSSSKIDIICPIHGIFKQTPNKHLCGHGCQKCYQSKKLTKEEFIEKSIKSHGEIYSYEKVIYENKRKKVEIICQEHGSFFQMPYDHYHGHGCPFCFDESKGEKIIKSFFDENNIKIERQKSFDGCKYKLKLKFDFYLIDHNICIEYDGQQHFKPLKVFGGLSVFEENKIRK